MNILPINYNKPYSIGSVQKNKNLNSTSFCSKIKISPNVKNNINQVGSFVPFIDFVEHSVRKHNKSLEAPANAFLAELQSIAIELKEYGFDFDMETAQKTKIKSAKSVASKIQRSKTLQISDRIRGTIYCKNIYDLSLLFDKLLPAMKKNYVVADTELALEDALKRGYNPTKEDLGRGYIMYPDFDIRLNKEFVQNVEAIPHEYRHSLGEPQSSGYEDIQIRFKKKEEESGNKSKSVSKSKKVDIPHELIILVGDEYAKAKHDESEKIYSFTRQFKELNILNNSSDAPEINLLKRRIKFIKDTFSNEITQKVYANAMDYDMCGIRNNLSISVSEEDERKLSENYNNIDKITRKYYKRMIEKATNSEEIRFLSAQKDADMQRLATIRTGLTRALKFYRQKSLKNQNM